MWKTYTSRAGVGKWQETGYIRGFVPPIPAHLPRALLDGVKDALRAIADRLFRADDALALRHGWEIISTRSGLGRVYRDNRFGQLARRPDCRGEGCAEGGEGHDHSRTAPAQHQAGASPS